MRNASGINYVVRNFHSFLPIEASPGCSTSSSSSSSPSSSSSTLCSPSEPFLSGVPLLNTLRSTAFLGIGVLYSLPSSSVSACVKFTLPPLSLATPAECEGTGLELPPRASLPPSAPVFTLLEVLTAAGLATFLDVRRLYRFSTGPCATVATFRRLVLGPPTTILSERPSLSQSSCSDAVVCEACRRPRFLPFPLFSLSATLDASLPSPTMRVESSASPFEGSILSCPTESPIMFFASSTTAFTERVL
uniref:Uncharacterized protein n=1 Tax=Opuntia streptacantha TaxID=393608 RepID=A0A7C9EDU7_OPUST